MAALFLKSTGLISESGNGKLRNEKSVNNTVAKSTLNFFLAEKSKLIT